MSNMCAMLVGVLVLCFMHVSGAMAPAPRKDNVEVAEINNKDFAFPDEVDTRKVYRSNYHVHQHHHHHPDFHYHNHGWDENSSEEGSYMTERPKVNSNTSLQIPLEFIRNINEHNVSDLLLNFVEGDGASDTALILDRFGEGAGTERNAALMAKKAACMPELQTVKIATSDDPSIMYIPECTRIERCGGCCSHTLLACQPQEVEYVNYKVFKTQYTGGKKLKIVGKEVVLVEKHNKCKCDCRVQPEDCNKFQEYNQAQCRCSCINSDEEKKCNKNNDTKLWNPDSCVCQCRETLQCSTGSYFDQRDCRCVRIPMKRRFADDTQSYSYHQVQVVPLDGDD